LWSILFLILTSLLSLSIVIHDLALLEETLRPSILSIPNMKYATPCLWEWLSCLQCRRRFTHLQRKNRCWGTIIPVWTMFHMLAFMVVLYPVAFTVYMLAPVRMSRIMVFLSAILCILWSIIFVIETAMDTQPYAVLWGTTDAMSGNSCICICEFYLSRSVILRVVVLGTGVCWNSFNLTLRALKGLRRAQWANMFSVLYAVPIEAFPVVWERPAGSGPIRHRAEGEAIQSEPAFDPFCLMDEQPESAWTRALITPEAQTEHQHLLWEPFAGALDTEIGCCGFPRPVVWDQAAQDGLDDSTKHSDGEAEADYRDERDDRDFIGASRKAQATNARRASASRPARPSEIAEMESLAGRGQGSRPGSQLTSPLSWGAWGGSRPSSSSCNGRPVPSTIGVSALHLAVDGDDGDAAVASSESTTAEPVGTGAGGGGGGSLGDIELGGVHQCEALSATAPISAAVAKSAGRRTPSRSPRAETPRSSSAGAQSKEAPTSAVFPTTLSADTSPAADDRTLLERSPDVGGADGASSGGCEDTEDNERGGT